MLFINILDAGTLFFDPVIYKVSLFFSEDYLCCNNFEDGIYHTDNRVERK